MANGEVHSQHRERMRRRFQQQGLDGFADHEVLELLLYLCIPRGDVNPTAHRLKTHFGSLYAVLEASPEELTAVEGIGPTTALNIHFLAAFYRRCRTDRAQAELAGVRLNTVEKLGAYFVPQFEGLREEVLLAAYMDNSGRVLRCDTAARGGAAGVQIDLAQIARTAVLIRAAGVALAHNHPGGDVSPSSEDISLTRRADSVLESLQLHLVDHIVVAGERYSSIGRLIRPIGGRR